ncbi:MAG: hypothetical protein H0U62_05545 [Actinobacteria bacterium]|nr:hypothetical protein [Actinomycetota bacterium]
MSYEWWRLTHGVLSTVVVVAALVHIYLVGYYVDTVWKQALWAGMTLTFVGLLLWTRIVVPSRCCADRGWSPTSWRRGAASPRCGCARTATRDSTSKRGSSPG